MSLPNFRATELKYAHPITGARFWIEWEQEVEVKKYKEERNLINLIRGIIGLKKILTEYIEIEKEWQVFHDPASTDINSGYLTLVDANYAIERYMINRTPIHHYYETKHIIK